MEEEKNNKVKKEKIKRKRKVSILTVFLWIMLIAVMSIITINGIVKNNAVEGETRKITIRVDFSEFFENEGVPDLAAEGLTEDAKVEFMQFGVFSLVLKTNNLTDDDVCGGFEFITNEGDIGVYEVEVTDEAKYILYVPFLCSQNSCYNIESKENEIIYINGKNYGEKIKENQDVYEVKIKKREDLRTITVKVDISEYRPENLYMGTSKVDNIINNSDHLSCIDNYIAREENIEIYEVEIINEAKYVYIEDTMCRIENGVEIFAGDTFFGLEIKEEQDVYEMKLIKRKDVNVKIKMIGLDENEMDKKAKEIEVVAGDAYPYEEYAKFKFEYIDNMGNYVYGIDRDELIRNMEDDTYYYIYICNEKVDGYAMYESEVIYDEEEGMRLSKSHNKDEIFEENIELKYAKETKVKINFEVEGIEKDKINQEELMEKIYANLTVMKRYDYGFNYINSGYMFNRCDEITVNKYIKNDKIVMECSQILPNEVISWDTRGISSLGVGLKCEINGKIQSSKNGYIYFTTLNSGEELNINAKIIYTDENTMATQEVKWIDKERGVAEIELGYTSTCLEPARVGNIIIDSGRIIYKENLSNEFILSSEYENNSQWSILDSVSSEEEKGIPKDVLNEFNIVEENRSTGKKYVYVKNTNTVYWLEDEISLGEGSTKVNVVYKDYEKLTEEKEIESSNDSTLVYDNSDEQKTYIENYNIASPKIKFSHKKEAVIKVEKNIKGEVGSNTYYVGIFRNKDDKKTDKIYEINTENGKGSIAIDTEGEKVYIYEVDKSGNKLIDENIKYSKNEIEFKNYVRDSKITTDKSVISSVMSETIGKFDGNNLENNDEKWNTETVEEEYYGKIFLVLKSAIANTDVNKTVGAGEEDYIDNVLEVVDIYQEEVLISSEEIKYKVEYVAEEGGTLEGITNEVVKANEYITNEPKVVSNEGYKFVRFEVEENGKRIEVDPSKYAITKDTVFYIVFEPEEVMGLPNTSDINVYMYVGIFAIAILSIIIVLFIINKNGKK